MSPPLNSRPSTIVYRPYSFARDVLVALSALALRIVVKALASACPNSVIVPVALQRWLAQAWVAPSTKV